jgi:hypothetical protein
MSKELEELKRLKAIIENELPIQRFGKPATDYEKILNLAKQQVELLIRKAKWDEGSN